jgi:thiol-disulfide isomerase/thioredoxin
MHKACLFAPLLLLAAAPADTNILETRWTKKVQLAAAKSGTGTSLPEVRVYDARGQLLLRTFGAGKGTAVRQVTGAIRNAKPVAGPSLAEAMRVLETRDGRPAARQIGGRGRIIVVDYWAEWCVPCKFVSRELAEWTAQQGGTVLLVHAETDPMKGKAFKHIYLDKDGKELKVD